MSGHGVLSSTGSVGVGAEALDAKMSLPVMGKTLSVAAGVVEFPPIAMILCFLAASSACFFNWAFVTVCKQHGQISLRPIVVVC